MRGLSFVLLMVAIVAADTASAQTNPVQVATSARFDMLGDANTGPLTNGYFLAGDGSAGRQTWIATTDQPRSFTATFTVTHFGWLQAAFKFTPASNGTVNLTLRGPWEQSTNGLIYKQEVLWDACSAVNSVLTNGSFERVSGGLPTGWYRTYGTDAAVDNGPVQPVDGTNYIRVWHDGPLSCNFSVTGGVPVTLTFFARAVFPSSWTDMTRLLSTSTPAHIAARRFMRGMNMGNYLEVPPGEGWDTIFTQSDFTNVRSQGFDHVRIPVCWNCYTGPGPNYIISNSIFPRVEFVLTNSLNQGLAAIINIHNWPQFTTNALGYTNEFYAIWRQVAAYYSNSPPQVAFELINEPSGPGSSTAILNPIYAEAIRQIRLSNPTRTIFVGPSQWNGISELGNLLLPDSDSNLIVTVHCYDPMYFTHQGASWAGPDFATIGVQFPGPPLTPLTPVAGLGPWATNWINDYNTLSAEGNPSSPLAFQAKFAVAAQWASYYGRPVHIGEFGVYTNADAVSRARFHTEYRRAAEAQGLGWAMWNWNANFYYWNNATHQPAVGLPAALFPPPGLSITAPGQLQVTSAIAKVIRLDTLARGVSGNLWVSLQTNTLLSPIWNYTDPPTNRTGAFYRAAWLN